MEIKVYGSRGSLPTPSTEGFSTHEFGGNTTCFSLRAKKGGLHIIDAGSGIRTLGLDLMRNGFGKGEGKLDLYFTHTHWDHIQGFPFFVPAYVPGNHVDVWGEAMVGGQLIEALKNSDVKVAKSAILHVRGDGIERVLQKQQHPRNFPAPLEAMVALGSFYDFIPGSHLREYDGLVIETTTLNHPGGCVSYKFKEGDKTAIISTDFEPDRQNGDPELIRWWAGADFVIADGQYEIGSQTNPFMEGWGHSDFKTDVEYALAANVKRLVLNHHDPKSDDDYLRQLEHRAKEYAKFRSGQLKQTLEVVLAREGDVYKI